jgi:ADP-heptose:LPS heptosyltransferase
MKIETAYHNWQQFLAGNSIISPEIIAGELSSSFMSQLAADEKPDFRAIDLLCEMALFEEDFQLRKAAVAALYKNIVEPLCDDFTTRGVEFCNLVLLRMIGFIRRQKEGERLNCLLNELNYPDQNLLLQRYEKIHQDIALSQSLKDKIRKILVLSRVTVGADVAITSIMVHRLARSFPQAEIIVYGPSHLPEIFYGLPRVHWAKFHYQRDGGLIGRLTSYTYLYQQLKMEWEGLHDGQTLLFDPDSRLSQLALFPLLADRYTRHFPSRNDQQDNSSRLSQLTNRWLNQVLGEQINILPQISIRPAHLDNIKRFFAQFPLGCKKIVINLGVGNDFRKRLPDPFEEKLLAGLLQDDSALVVLDSGAHPDERERARALMDIMQMKTFQAVSVSEKNLASKQIPFHHGLVCIQGGIGMLSALIDQADVFFGYDSCCQHLATARGTNSIICFAGAPNDRFFDRWRPLDKSGLTTTIPIQDSTHLTDADLTELAEKFCRMILADKKNF